MMGNMRYPQPTKQEGLNATRTLARLQLDRGNISLDIPFYRTTYGLAAMPPEQKVGRSNRPGRTTPSAGKFLKTHISAETITKSSDLTSLAELGQFGPCARDGCCGTIHNIMLRLQINTRPTAIGWSYRAKNGAVETWHDLLKIRTFCCARPATLRPMFTCVSENTWLAAANLSRPIPPERR
jgi:hypothetical protein